MGGMEPGGMLPSRKSLVPRKTLMATLRSMASALPQVTEQSDAETSLPGRISYAQGGIAAARLGDSRVGGNKRDQLLEVSTGQVVSLTWAQNDWVFQFNYPSYSCR